MGPPPGNEFPGYQRPSLRDEEPERRRRFPRVSAWILVSTLLPAAFALAETGAFRDVTRQSGLAFVHDPAVGGEYSMPESIGAGGALFDYDGDGDLDVYLVNGRENRLYRQEGDGTFADVTEASGLGDAGYGMGVAVGDVDGDGAPDVYVTNYGPDALWRNRGDGTFLDVTRTSGVDNPAWGCSAVFFDMEPDGDLDLYVTNYVDFDPAVVCTDAAGERDYCGPAGWPGVADRLFRNDGGGTFTDVSRAAGISRVARKGLGVTSADFDGDGRADVYVANDGEPNLLWIRGGSAAVYEDRAVEMGAAVNLLGQPEAGMGIALGDADGDGRWDLFVTHLRTESNTLYRGAGDLGFVDATLAAGLDGAGRPFTGFGTAFFDADHDGDLDLAVANGRVTRGPLLKKGTPASFWDAYAEPNFLFWNDGAGRFRDAGAGAGDLASLVENSRGLATGDVDGDGDVDLLVTQDGGPARLLRNDAAAGGWLVVQVLQAGSRGDAIGATVTVEAGGRRQLRLVGTGSSFLSASDPRVHFGLGSAAAVDELRVRWPGGGAVRVRGLPANRRVAVPGGRRR